MSNKPKRNTTNLMYLFMREGMHQKKKAQLMLKYIILAIQYQILALTIH